MSEKVYLDEAGLGRVLGKIDTDIVTFLQDQISFKETYSLSINSSGQFVETTPEGTKTTTFNSDGSITEVYPDGKTYTTTFGSDDSVTRVLEVNTE